MLAKLRVYYVEFSTLLYQFVLRGQNDASSEVDDSMGACTKNVVPDSTNCFDTRKHMGEPSENPGNDENYKIDLSKALKYGLKLFVLCEEQGQNHFTNENSKSSNVISQEVPKVSFSSFFHQVVALVVPKKNNKDRSHVMKTLNVL